MDFQKINNNIKKNELQNYSPLKKSTYLSSIKQSPSSKRKPLINKLQNINPFYNLHNHTPKINKNNIEQKSNSTSHTFTLNVLQQIINQNRQSSTFMGMLLGDPTLKQLSQNLQKQAQQNRKKQLLNNFPIRYQQLLKYQTKYWQIQKINQQKNKQIQYLQTTLQNAKQSFKKQIQILHQQILLKQETYQNAIKQFQQRDTHKISQYRQLNDQYFKLKYQISECQRIIDNLKYQLQSCQNKNADLLNQIASLKKTYSFQLQSLKSQKQSLRDIIKSSQNKFNSLQNQTSVKEKHILQSLREKQEQIIALQKKIRMHGIQLENLKQSHQKQLAEKYEQTQIIRQKYLQTVQQIQQLQNQYQSLKEQLNDQKKQHLKLKQKYEIERQQLIKGQQFVQMLKNQLTKLQNQHQKSIKTHVDHNFELSKSNKELNQKVINLQKDINTSKINQSNLQRQNKKISDMLQKLQNQHDKFIQNSNNSIGPLNQIVFKLKQQLDQSIQNNKSLNKKTISLENKIQQIDFQNKSLKQQNRKLKDEIKILKQSNYDFNNKKQQKCKSIIHNIQQHRKLTTYKMNQKQRQLRQIKQLVIQNMKQNKKNQTILKQFYQSQDCRRKQCCQTLQDYRKLKLIVQKMKQEMIQIFSNVQQRAARQKQLFQQVLHQNKMLKGLQ